MKTKKNILRFLAAVIVMLFCASTNLSAQADSTMKQCCCKMKKGKMMCMKDGKETAMKKDTTMQDGTKCMVNGECIMKDGKKMKMKEGDCMNTDGKMGKCDHKSKKEKKDKKSSAAYACPMHPEITSDKAAKCSKCGMDLEKKK